MAVRSLVFFASDVHLGLAVRSPEDRERRFLHFLKTIPAEQTKAVYLLGDVWDFWYEYRDVVPKTGLRVVAAMADLVDAGVEVYFFPGNHDIWCFGYFETLGIKVVHNQPLLTKIGGKQFCVGHGDGLGKGYFWYKVLNRIFKSSFLQWCFSLLHPHTAFGLAHRWSRGSRLAHGDTYRFKGEEEPLYQYCVKYAKKHEVDYFVFGHLHEKVEQTLPKGQQLFVLDSWIGTSPYLVFDGTSLRSGYLPNME